MLASPRRPLAPLLVLLITLAGCGGSGGGDGKDGDARKDGPVLGQGGDEEQAAQGLGFPGFATKNTTRVGGADPVADAAAVAQAVFPSRSPDTRPAAVTLVDKDDWRAAISASQLMSRPLRAPLLLSDGDKLPAASASALGVLHPAGAEKAGKAQVLRIGATARPRGYRSSDVEGGDFAALAAGIDRLHTAAAGSPSPAVVVAPAGSPAFAMPAAGWAAKQGDPVLWAERDRLPAATRAAIVAHRRPRIYILGPPAGISDAVAKQLEGLGTVRRIAGNDPVANAIAFARFTDGRFGWNAVDPGHGLVFATSRRPVDAAAAAALSASGTYGPLLLVAEARALPRSLQDYLLDVQPGYDDDPVRGVYNHGWLVGDESAISVDVQARIDALLEIQPVEAGAECPFSQRSTRNRRPPITATHQTHVAPHQPQFALDSRAVAEAEQPERLRPERTVTVDDVRQLMGASTPHFALQLRNRIAKLIADTPPGDPARLEGEREIARLNRIAFTGETRGEHAQPGQRTLPSLDEDEPTRFVEGAAPG